jgi:DNA-binding NarL/FixJ family response regulator
MRTWNIMIIADEPRRRRIKESLSIHSNVTIVGELISTSSFHLVAQLEPDLVIIDSLAVAINPIYALLALRSTPHTPLVMVLRATNHLQERKFWAKFGAQECPALESSHEIREALSRILAPLSAYTGGTPQQLGALHHEYLSV